MFLLCLHPHSRHVARSGLLTRMMAISVKAETMPVVAKAADSGRTELHAEVQSFGPKGKEGCARSKNYPNVYL